MKNYTSLRKYDTAKSDVWLIVSKIVNDKRAWEGGIPCMDSELQEMGFTRLEATKICTGVMNTINRLCKKAELIEKYYEEGDEK